MKLFYYIKRFWEIPGVEKKLFLKGLLLSGIINIGMTILPYKVFLGVIAAKSNSKLKNPDFDLRKISISKKTINRLLVFCPWRINCLVKAIVLKSLLKDFGIASAIVFSVKKDSFGIAGAHAYLLLNNNTHFFRIPSYVDIQLPNYCN